jgi:hypothetical protein
MDKELLEKLIELVKTTPNDMELGKLIRAEVNKHSNNE